VEAANGYLAHRRGRSGSGLLRHAGSCYLQVMIGRPNPKGCIAAERAC
jgi:hypothetical protein